ncbi:MAG: type III pantothenate kinase [Allisonella histaminiformans]|mgnify:FL=1|uniref:type III pantothenate kinase n=1 Tax=Allisonella histaminiformans TaxID=209880 RepID=UPI002353A7DB|nr:type III pantothenate kinase [Allisonella histaminiformans]MCI6002806.1 type III pantothenate kinase [Allisonella histaminiformans]MDD6871077.1 type III pantothenate kinase [Allisonella histaminiformans]MDY3957233.1 type III pantothenate kinase [Allisonella histaminiformans]MDY4540618.1 type III pantothenate kinase [Allisonella histaminiformans]
MLLVFDVGNTNIVLGLYDGDKMIYHWRAATNELKTADEYAASLGMMFQLDGVTFDMVTDIIISSVVPPVNPTLEYLCRRYFHVEPMMVGPGMKTGLNILYDNPRELGADRIVNAVAGITLYGGPLIIIDLGTATTFCAIDEKKRYLGGAVTPGIGISMEALFQRASKLPRIELTPASSVICKNTVSAMQSGIYYGAIGQVDGIVRRMKKEMGYKEIKVIATGGLADLIASQSETIDVIDPLLTLKGLYILFKKNRK